MKTRPLSAALLLATLLACKLFQPSPEKVCKQKEKLGGEPQASCVEPMTALKKKNPDHYACVSKCVMKADSKDEVDECSTEECPTSLASDSTATSGASENEDDVATFVDDLSSSTVKSRIEREYQYYGYELVKETSNDVGWAGSIRLGKPGSEAQIYRVILGDASSHSEGAKLARGLFSGEQNPTAWKAGRTKFIFIECVAQVSTINREPGRCISGDRTDDMLNAVAKPY